MTSVVLCHTSAFKYLSLYMLCQKWQNKDVHSSKVYKTRRSFDEMIPAGIYSGLIQGSHPTNERRRYKMPPPFIGWAQT